MQSHNNAFHIRLSASCSCSSIASCDPRCRNRTPRWRKSNSNLKSNPQGLLPYTQNHQALDPRPRTLPLFLNLLPQPITRRACRSRTEKTPLREHCGANLKETSGRASETATPDGFPRGFSLSGELAVNCRKLWKWQCVTAASDATAVRRRKLLARALPRKGGTGRSFERLGATKKGLPGPKTPHSSFTWIPRHPRS